MGEENKALLEQTAREELLVPVSAFIAARLRTTDFYPLF
jgi:hypothetical protein